MESITFKKIVDFTNGKVINSFDENFMIKNIKIDSREVDKDSLFIPIIGENNDGHIFLESAYNLGCRNFLIDENHEFIKEDINIAKVSNTTISFGDISRNYKNLYDLITIAVTGSVGKTSTRDIIYSVVNKKYKTLKNEGNLNNEIGVPKTILNLDKTYEAIVCEMGMSQKGEIDYLASIARPNIAVISNIGTSHIEFFENQEGIFDAKMEIINYFKENDTLIVNGDDKFLKTLKLRKIKLNLFTYGFNEENDIYCISYKIENGHIDFTCMINDKPYDFTIPTIAKHNIYNAMSAILVGLKLNMPIDLIKEGLSSFEVTKGRQTLINKKDITIIDDSYNASVDSIISALEVLKTFNKRKVAIIGDILETGTYEEELHRKIGKNIKENCDYFIGVGNSIKYAIEETINDGFDKEKIKHYENYEELLKDIDNIIEKEDVLLLKSSHGIKLYKVVEYLEKNYE